MDPMSELTDPVPAVNPLTGKVTQTREPRPVATLTLRDRCCSCGAQAFMSAVMPNATEPLLFCGHHGTKHREALVAQGATVVDERHRINERPTDPEGEV